MNSSRQADIERTTGESSVEVGLDIDGRGEYEVSTGVGFLNHMLELFARHGRFDLRVKASGDTEVDAHHTVEDVGIVLGKAFGDALGDKKGIRRYADVRLPMQESLCAVALDICGRSFLVYNVTFPSVRTGDFDLELVEEFFVAFANNARLTLHIDLIRGTNAHHIAESVYKSTARALSTAAELVPEQTGQVPSTKGTLE